MGRLLLVVCLLLSPAAAQKKQVSEEEVRRVHRSALLIDTHNDVTGETVQGLDIGVRRASGHTDLPRLRAGGVGATFFAVYVAAQYVEGNRAPYRALEMIDTVRRDIVERYSNDFALALTADEIVAARKRGKIAALLGIEGGHAIQDSLRLLRTFYQLGVRYMTLTHSNTNNWADSSGDLQNPKVKHHNGLTELGKQIVGEMNRLGMMVDISHVSDKTFWDALEASQAPIFASHSSCRALAGIDRNMTDEMIQALGKKGGVIQINFGCSFLSAKAAEASRELFRELRGAPEETAEQAAARRKARFAELRGKTPRATLDDAVAHIDRVVKLAGIDAVGIGSDFDGVNCVPTGLDDVSKFPNLTRALLEKGYTPEQIRKIYGGNTLRLMRAVEKTARELQAKAGRPSTPPARALTGAAQ